MLPEHEQTRVGLGGQHRVDQFAVSQQTVGLHHTGRQRVLAGPCEQSPAGFLGQLAALLVELAQLLQQRLLRPNPMAPL